MKKLTSSFEALLEQTIKSLGYDTVRNVAPMSNTTFRQLPAIVIHPIEITEIEGGQRGRVTLGCILTAVKCCAGMSQYDISTIIEDVRRDATSLSAKIMQSNIVVDIEALELTYTEAKEQPQQRVVAQIEMEVVVCYDNKERSC